ncbi:MAG: GNAT family N-acetyltransferase [Salibacteraceae bacterium]
MKNSKQTYRADFNQFTSGLIFQSPTWLDLVAGPNNWDVAIAYQGDFISGALPYVTNTKYGLKQITIPFLTPYLGPIFRYPSDLSNSKKLSYQKKTLESLINQIPDTDRFITQSDFNFDYWLPFYWNGFQQTTRYSFTLNTTPSEDELLAGFKPNIKKHIKNASKLFKVEEGRDIKPLFAMHKSDLNKKNTDLHFSKEQLEKVYLTLQKSGDCKIFNAVDERNEVVSAFFIVFDKHFTHYLLGTVKPKHRHTGVMSLLMWTVIKEAKSRGLTFNFEGSMHQSIERFFSSFGGQPQPYMQISKTSNKWLKEFTRFNH